jgi:hypothetical protein
MIPIHGLFETHLTVAGLPRSMDFYGGVLGLELARVFPERKVAFFTGSRAPVTPCWDCGKSERLRGRSKKPPQGFRIPTGRHNLSCSHIFGDLNGQTIRRACRSINQDGFRWHELGPFFARSPC